MYRGKGYGLPAPCDGGGGAAISDSLLLATSHRVGQYPHDYDEVVFGKHGGAAGSWTRANDYKFAAVTCICFLPGTNHAVVVDAGDLLNDRVKFFGAEVLGGRSPRSAKVVVLDGDTSLQVGAIVAPEVEMWNEIDRDLEPRGAAVTKDARVGISFVGLDDKPCALHIYEQQDSTWLMLASIALELPVVGGRHGLPDHYHHPMGVFAMSCGTRFIICLPVAHVASVVVVEYQHARKQAVVCDDNVKEAIMGKWVFQQMPNLFYRKIVVHEAGLVAFVSQTGMCCLFAPEASQSIVRLGICDGGGDPDAIHDLAYDSRIGFLVRTSYLLSVVETNYERWSAIRTAWLGCCVRSSFT